MTSNEEKTLDARLRSVEREVSMLSAVVERNTGILDDIREHMNKPVNPGWVGASVAVLGLVGTLLWTAFINPIDQRVNRLETENAELRAHVRDIGDYAKETRAIVDERGK